MGNKSNICSTCNEENEAILNDKNYTQIKKDIINNSNTIGHSYIIPLSDTRRSSNSLNISNRPPSKNDLSNQTQYFGDIVEGKKQGKGKLIFSDGSFYEGNFKDDLFNGNGILVKDNYIYKGDFLNGKKHGKGKIEITYKLNNNDNINNNDNNIIINNINDNIIEKKIYEGEWENDYINGDGLEIIQNENNIITTYNGHFIKGKKNGKGKLVLSNGSEYYGDFNDDLLNGNGIFKWNENKYYNGQWNKNCIEGFGILFEEKKKYIGYFKKDKKNGIGACYYINNNIIVIGKWILDKLDNGIAVVIDNEKNENIVKMENEIIVKKYNDEEIDNEKIRDSDLYKEYMKIYEEKIKCEIN